MTAPSRPRIAALPRGTAMRLAATEYERFADLLRVLGPGDWARPTECPGWDVRAMAAHAGHGGDGRLDAGNQPAAQTGTLPRRVVH